MTPLTIVQARMSSQRLPGKVLMRIGPKTILEWVLHRLSLCEADLGQIVVATSTDPTDDPVAELCQSLNVECCRGSLDDVLDRYLHCAVHHDGNPIIRITADSPLLCPRLLEQLIDGYRPDYTVIVGVPRGLGMEAFSRHALNFTWRNTYNPDDREHVVTWMQDNLRSHEIDVGPNRLPLNFSIDTQTDLDRIRWLYRLTDQKLFDMDARTIIEHILTTPIEGRVGQTIQMIPNFFA
jgi:spore coat polysaccharide biosynthesis protein SpsF